MIERIFGISAAEFLAEHWPDRVLLAARPPAIDDPVPALASLVAELGLSFVAHACRVELVAAPFVASTREVIVVGRTGTVRGRVGDADVSLEPGAAMFVPRGIARRIDASTDARVLVFSFGVPTWADMLATTLLHELADAEPLRAPSFAALPEHLSLARDEVLELLASAPPPKARS